MGTCVCNRCLHRVLLQDEEQPLQALPRQRHPDLQAVRGQRRAGPRRRRAVRSGAEPAVGPAPR